MAAKLIEMYRLENDQLIIGVKPTGAELCSLKDRKTDLEYVWQADPSIWVGHAPNLFPVIGLLKDGTYRYDGKEYEMPKHGFIRHNKNISLKEQTDSSLSFQLSHSEETLKIYPFRFRYEIKFRLDGRTLYVLHEVRNLDEKPMYFSLGGHPAFNAPIKEGEDYEDYYLQFDQKQDLESNILNEDGLVTSETKTITKNDDRIGLHKHLFDNDALIFKNIPSKKVALKSKNHGTILTVKYEDFKHLGVWAKPAAPYVCIEPWLGIADPENTNGDLKTKEGIIEIMPSQPYNASYSIDIE